MMHSKTAFPYAHFYNACLSVTFNAAPMQAFHADFRPYDDRQMQCFLDREYPEIEIQSFYPPPILEILTSFCFNYVLAVVMLTRNDL